MKASDDVCFDRQVRDNDGLRVGWVLQSHNTDLRRRRDKTVVLLRFIGDVRSGGRSCMTGSTQVRSGYVAGKVFG